MKDKLLGINLLTDVRVRSRIQAASSYYRTVIGVIKQNLAFPHIASNARSAAIGFWREVKDLLVVGNYKCNLNSDLRSSLYDVTGNLKIVNGTLFG